jgi:hypothetical protein
MKPLNRPGAWLLGIGIWILLSQSPALASAAVRDLDFSYRNGRITLKTKGASLVCILETIAAAAHIRSHLMEAVDASITTELVEKPLAETLRVLLRGASYAVIYGNSAPAVLTYGQGAGIFSNIGTLTGTGSSGRAAGHRRTVAPGRSARPGSHSKNRSDAAPGTPDRPSGSGSSTPPPPGAASVSTSGAGNWSSAGSQTSAETGAETETCQSAGSETASGDITSQAATADTQSGSQSDSLSSQTEIPSGVKSLIQQGASSAEINAYCQQRITDLETRIDSGQSDFSYNHFVRLKGEQFVTHDRELLEMYQSYASDL